MRVSKESRENIIIAIVSFLIVGVIYGFIYMNTTYTYIETLDTVKLKSEKIEKGWTGYPTVYRYKNTKVSHNKFIFADSEYCIILVKNKFGVHRLKLENPKVVKFRESL